MKLIILILGIAIGAIAVWYYRDQPKGSPARDTGERIESAVRSAGDSLQETLRSWDLDTDTITSFSYSGQAIDLCAEIAP